MPNDPAAHRRGVLMMIGAALCWSSGGLLVRVQSVGNGWEIVFWRSLFMGLFVAATLSVLYRRRVLAQILAVGRAGLWSSLFWSGAFFFYILALTHTTVANTSVIMALSPFLAALAGALLLRERVATRTWVAMALAFGGMVLMFAESLGSGRVLGNLLALGPPLCLALNLVVLRRAHATVSMLPTVLLAAGLSALVALPLAAPFTAAPSDVAVLAFMGCVQLGTGCLLMTLAARHLPAAEIGLLSLLEPILAPVWAWLGVGERPSAMAIAGGTVVLAALAANEGLAFVRTRRAAALS